MVKEIFVKRRFRGKKGNGGRNVGGDKDEKRKGNGVREME